MNEMSMKHWWNGTDRGITAEKPVLVSLYQPQIPYGLA
jgi:hypothetical protein